MTKREWLRYTGDMAQVAGIRDCTLRGGKAEGIRALDFCNGSGLAFTVLPDRAMDIGALSYKGINGSYLSKTGPVAPSYYNEAGAGFLRGFYGGFLTTCGLSNVGTACEENGKTYGTHGRISHTPAEEVYSRCAWGEDGLYHLEAGGWMREAVLFGENLVLERKIGTVFGQKGFVIRDRVENRGFNEEPLMLLYHFNLGYPLLSGESYLVAPIARTLPRSERAAEGLGSYTRFQAPEHGFSEQVYYHEMKGCADGRTFAALINPALSLGIAIRFHPSQLPRMTQWKQMGEGEYVLGIEPCNCHVEGRVRERELGTLEILKAGASRQVDIEIEILEGEAEIEALKAEAI